MRSRSAGGQLEHPSEVNSSTRTGIRWAGGEEAWTIISSAAMMVQNMGLLFRDRDYSGTGRRLNASRRGLIGNDVLLLKAIAGRRPSHLGQSDVVKLLYLTGSADLTRNSFDTGDIDDDRRPGFLGMCGV